VPYAGDFYDISSYSSGIGNILFNNYNASGSHGWLIIGALIGLTCNRWLPVTLFAIIYIAVIVAHYLLYQVAHFNCP